MPLKKFFPVWVKTHFTAQLHWLFYIQSIMFCVCQVLLRPTMFKLCCIDMDSFHCFPSHGNFSFLKAFHINMLSYPVLCPVPVCCPWLLLHFSPEWAEMKTSFVFFPAVFDHLFFIIFSSVMIAFFFSLFVCFFVFCLSSLYWLFEDA